MQTITKSTILQNLASHRSEIRNFGVRQIGVFGSFRRNEEELNGNDIDVYVEFEEGMETFDNFMGLSFMLDELFKGKEVVVVTSNRMSRRIEPFIRKNIVFVELNQQQANKMSKKPEPPTNYQNPEKMKKQTIEEIRHEYPDQWVLIAEPELKDPETLGSIVSKLERGFVLLASKDKREIGYKTKEARKGYKSVTCIYTGEIPQNRKWLL